VLKGTGSSGEISGQARIRDSGGVSRVELLPGDASPPAAALEAIAEADQVVIGPGSLYTSLLAATAVDDLRLAIAETPAQIVYVANLREQPPETAGLDVAGHVEALLSHRVRLDAVLADDSAMPLGAMPRGPRLETARLAGSAGSHDPALLASALSDLLAGAPRAERG
jgi:uncharacterized cofD-like protein